MTCTHFTVTYLPSCQTGYDTLHITTWLPPANLFLPAPTKLMGNSAFGIVN